MNFKDCLTQLKSSIIDAATLEEKNDREVRRLGRMLVKLFNTKWHQAFPNTSIRALSGLECGCHCKDWQPVFFVYSIGHHVQLEEGGWAEEVYKASLSDIKVVDCPISEQELTKFIVSFEEETGVTIEISKKRVGELVERVERTYEESELEDED